MENPETLVRELAELVRRLDLTDVELAAMMGVSPLTARNVLRKRRLPDRRPTREAVARWIETHRAAAARSDLRIHGGAS